MECRICIEDRKEKDDPSAICGYCEADRRNAAGADPYAFVRIERLAVALELSELDEIAKIVKIAEKVSRAECGYTQEDLTDAIKSFQKQVSLEPEEWEAVHDKLQIFPKTKYGLGARTVEIARKIKEQL